MKIARFRAAVVLAGLCLATGVASRADLSAVPTAKQYLHKDWRLQSSCEVKATGAELSAVEYDASKWHRAEVPGTVVGALVTDKTYPDPNYGTNLRLFPGM